MLKINNSNAEQTFASHNSINMNPQVFAEWNYNSFMKPYNVYPSLTAPVVLFESTSNFFANNNGTVAAGGTDSYTTDIRTTTNSLKFNTKLDGKYSPTIFTSIPITVTGNKYYKLTFYAKADLNKTVGSVKRITTSQITLTGTLSPVTKTISGASGQNTISVSSSANLVVGMSVSGTGIAQNALITQISGNTITLSAANTDAVSGTGTFTPPTYYFQVIPVNDNGNKLSFANDSTANTLSSDTASGRYSPTASPTISFPAQDAAIEYDIYVSDTKDLPKFYKTVSASAPDGNGNVSYSLNKDKGLSAPPTDIVKRASRADKINVSVVVDLHNTSDNNIITTIAGTSGQKTITVGDSSNLSVGMLASGTGISPNAVITSISNNTVTLSAANTGTVSGNGSFNLRISDSSFYVKFYDNENSLSKEMISNFDLNGVDYNKIEIYFGSISDFNKFKINLSINSLKDECSIFVDKFELVEIDDWVYDSSFYFPIENVFNQTMLGESLLNPLISDSDKKIYNDFLNKNVNKPVSFGYYNPDGIIFSSPRKNILSSTFNVFRYYVSKIEPYSNEESTHSITAKYDKSISLNKLVLKVSSELVKITGGEIKLYKAGSNTPVSTITVPSFEDGADDEKEYIALYYNGQTWGLRDAISFIPPTLTDSGLLKNCIDNISSITVSFNFKKKNENADYIKSRLHLIEISPRLEIDLSSLISGFSIDKTIDSDNSANGFPIGYMNANVSQIEMSNIPVYNAGLPYTIFSEVSERSTFKDLLREGIKFSINLVSPQQDFTGTIPVGIMYVNKWSLGSIDKVSVDLYDSMKYNLMSIESPQYSGMRESCFDTITNIFAVSGFSDYDYVSLKNILQSLTTTYFWTDIEKPLFESIKSFFISQQIGAWIDEYGILRFKNLKEIVNTYKNNDFKSKVDFAVTDKTLDSIGSSSITYIPNLIQDGFSYEISPKPGKIIINYKIPTVNVETERVVSGNLIYKENAKQVWEPQGNIASIYTFSSNGLDYGNEFKVDQKITEKITYGFGELKDEAFLGGEAISWEGLEYQFWGKDSSNPYKTIISDSSEIQSVIEKLRSENNTGDTFSTKKTGLVSGISRGKYGTQIQKHKVYLSSIPDGKEDLYADPKTEFDFKTTNNLSSLSDTPLCQFIQLSSNDINASRLDIAIPANKKKNPSIVYPKNFDASRCNFYATKFSYDKSFDVNDIRETGIFLNFTKINNSQNKSLYIGVQYKKYQTARIVIGNETFSSNNNKWAFCGFNSVKGFTKNAKQYLETNILLQPQKTYRLSMLITESGLTYFFLGKEKIGEAYLTYDGKIINSDDIKRFGVYHLHDTSSKNIIKIKELYAAEWSTKGDAFTNKGFLDEIENKKINYHFQSNAVLSNILRKIPIYNKYYLWESKITLRGITKFTDIDFGFKPIVPGSELVFPVSYDPNGTYVEFPGQPRKKAYNENLTKVVETDIAYSSPISSPFKLNLIMVNNGSQYTFVSTEDKKVGQVEMQPLQIWAKTQILSTDKRLEKVLNSKNLKDVLTIDSAWIQSEKDAENLSNYVKILSNTFNSTFNVRIYGNPLVQVGDFCQLIYSLREIGYSHEKGKVPRYFFVKSVKHNYSDGFSTELMLKPMFDMGQ